MTRHRGDIRRQYSDTRRTLPRRCTRATRGESPSSTTPDSHWPTQADSIWRVSVIAGELLLRRFAGARARNPTRWTCRNACAQVRLTLEGVVLNAGSTVNNVVLVDGGFVDGSGWQSVYTCRSRTTTSASSTTRPCRWRATPEITRQIIDAQDGPSRPRRSLLRRRGASPKPATTASWPHSSTSPGSRPTAASR